MLSHKQGQGDFTGDNGDNHLRYKKKFIIIIYILSILLFKGDVNGG